MHRYYLEKGGYLHFVAGQEHFIWRWDWMAWTRNKRFCSMSEMEEMNVVINGVPITQVHYWIIENYLPWSIYGSELIWFTS